MNIHDQVVFISGGASGMGAETARYLAKLGAKVTVFDQNSELSKKIATEINGLSVTGDVADAASVEMAFNTVKQHWGVPRICINCAGIAPGKLIVNKNATPMPLSDFSQVIQINLLGTFNVLRIAAAMMSTLEPFADNERGVIINTASIAAFEGQIGQIAYSASKSAIVGMTLPAARELSRFGIRVMTIAPGLIETPLLHGLPENVRENLAATIPFPKRFGTVHEYAKLARQIIENTMLNGSTIRLDGALRMAPK